VFDAIGWEIRNNDPHSRMLGIHENYGYKNQAYFYGDPYGKWTTFGDYQQAYGYFPETDNATPASRKNLHETLLRPRFGSPNNPNKPSINGEYAYYLRDSNQDGKVDKQNSHNRTDFRRASWALSMTGGYFVTGFASTYYGGWSGRGSPFDPEDPRNDVAIADLQRLRRFFTSRQWWRLEPHDELVSADHGYCLAELGKTYVVYAEESTNVLLKLGVESTATYRIALYDPRTGSYTDLADYTGSGPVTLTPPDTQDWIFLVSAKPAPAKPLSGSS
jgi:Putative collagen-binding domain of a collagenase